jgi:hypothetical protein
MPIHRGENTICALGFKERNVGKWFSQTKVKSEYSLLINYTHDVTIEVSNSRFSRKRRVIMNGELVEKLTRTSMSDFRYSWTYPVNDMVIVFSITPNSSASGTDLRINGEDFFNFVYEVESENPLGVTKGAYDTFMTFRVPPRDNPEMQSPRIATKSTPSTSMRQAGQNDTSSAGRQPLQAASINADNYATLGDSFE